MLRISSHERAWVVPFPDTQFANIELPLTVKLEPDRRLMKKLLAFVALVWIALLPPLFTRGACTEEYEAVDQLVTANKLEFSTPDAALAALQRRDLPARLLTPDDCARSKPRFLMQCSSGTLVYAEVPVRNRVCRIYRDDKTMVQLQYDRRDRLARTLVEMNPYKFLPLPWGGSINWAK